MSRPCTNLIMSCAALGTLTGDRRATVDLHRRLMREEPAALAAIDEAVSTGAVVSFTLRGEPATVGPYEPTPAPRRYLAVKLDAGLDTNGNGRRGWLVYLDTPESPILGWIEEEHGRADSDSMYELCSAILDAEGVEHMARTGAASYPHDVHALINSGRVRVLCSLKVPYSEIREARRTPFKLPVTTAADPNIYEASWYSARIVVTPEHDSGSCTVDAAYLMGSWKGHEAATSAIRACAEYGTPGTWDTPRGVMMVRRA